MTTANTPEQRRTAGISTAVTRGLFIQTLLDKLKEHDRLYLHHVPCEMLYHMKDDLLLSYLEGIYNQKEFIVEYPGIISHYSKATDKVIKKGYFEQCEWEIKEGTKGRVQGYRHDKALVKFRNVPQVQEISPSDLYMYGERLFFYELNYPLSDRRMLSAMTYWKTLAANPDAVAVMYMGKNPIKKRSCFVPDGAEGIITAKEGEGGPANYAITWAACDKLQYPIKQYFVQGPCYAFPHRFSSEDIKLVIPNTIAFESLVQECKSRGQPIIVDGIVEE